MWNMWGMDVLHFISDMKVTLQREAWSRLPSLSDLKTYSFNRTGDKMINETQIEKISHSSFRIIVSE